MARGSQDWVARTDILIQTLSEIIQRPRLGTMNNVTAAGAVGASGETELWNISGAGIHWGIYFLAVGAATCENDTLRYQGDGNTIVTTTFGSMKNANLTSPRSSEIWLTCFDEVNFYYGLAGGGGKTWSTEYIGNYLETYGRTPTVYLSMVYSAF